jgi:hypothetical protein
MSDGGSSDTINKNNTQTPIAPSSSMQQLTLSQVYDEYDFLPPEWWLMIDKALTIEIILKSLS